jgi:flagellar biosynthesis/type III secretory pathway protein FliH
MKSSIKHLVRGSSKVLIFSNFSFALLHEPCNSTMKTIGGLLASLVPAFLKNKEASFIGRKEKRKKGREGGKKEGREGGKEGRKQGKNEGRKEGKKEKSLSMR